jgi:hypothetical protein
MHSPAPFTIVQDAPIPKKIGGFTIDDDGPIEPLPELVEDTIPRDGICYIGGQSGAAKTILAIHLAICLAIKGLFFGREVVERVGTAFILAEGQAGFRNRLRAARVGHEPQLDKLPIAYIGDHIDFFDPQALDKLVAQIKLVDEHFRAEFDCRLGMIAYDTQGACFEVEDENSNAEANRTVKVVRYLGSETSTLQLPLHHYGKTAATGLRGASALRGAADVVLSVLADRDEQTGDCANRRLCVAKNREGQEGELSAFDLKFVELGRKDNAKPFGSCMISEKPAQEDDGTSSKGKRKGWGKAARRAEAIFRDSFMEIQGSIGKEMTPFGDGRKVLACDLIKVRTEFFRRYPAISDDDDSKDDRKGKDRMRKAFNRVLESNADRYRTKNEGDVTWIWNTDQSAPDLNRKGTEW